MNDVVLDLDIGNSSTKWRLDSRRGTIRTGQLPNLSERIARVRVSTVAIPEQQLLRQITELYDVQPEFAKVTTTLSGVRNGYEDVAQLGVDRWLALVAAWQRVQSDVIVFDLGTAMTADYVQKNGKHLGGYIVPGLNAMRDALGQSTRDVKVLQNKSESSPAKFGQSTQGAVHLGLTHAQIGWINSCIEVGSQFFGKIPTLVLTGRDPIHARLCQLLPFQYYPDLVLEGLAIALP